MENACSEIGFLEKNLGKIIHIAGTNGKGSTSYFIAQMLRKYGFKTALYTSPHIVNITERIKLDLEDVEYSQFYNAFLELKEIIVKHSLTFFEGLTLVAFKIITDFLPDYTILETGMGGRLDATNVTNSKLPVITTISQDHTNFLGKNIYDILMEKLAIVKDNSTVFVGYNKPFIIEKVKGILRGHNIYTLSSEDINNAANYYPIPYSYNYSLAKKVVGFLTGEKIPENSSFMLPPCRMEKIGRFILDGSHNPAGLLNTIKHYNADTVVFSCTKDRPLNRMICILKSKFKNIILTEIPDNTRSIAVDNINTDNTLLKEKDPFTAINKSIYISGKSDIVVTGSFFLCGYLRQFLEELSD
jgi:dihydrofolate synthase/folylpolyglutamate synthase